MSKEHFFKIESNKIELIKDEEIRDHWILYFEKYMYQDEVQRLVKEWKKPINEGSDMDAFTSWVRKKKKLVCWAIPKIYYIENNGKEFKERLI